MNNITLDKINTMAAELEAMKAQLAEPTVKSNWTNASPDFLAKNQPEWIAKGAHYKSLRESFGISKAKTARMLGVSTTKLTKFEQGGCVSHAALMENAYRMLMTEYKLGLMTTRDYSSELIEIICQNLQDGIDDDYIIYEIALTLRENGYKVLGSNHVMKVVKKIKGLKDVDTVARFVSKVYPIYITDDEISNIKHMSDQSFKQLISTEVH